MSTETTWLTTGEAVAHLETLGIAASSDRLRNWRQMGLRIYQPGGKGNQMYFKRTDLVAFIEGSVVK